MGSSQKTKESSQMGQSASSALQLNPYYARQYNQLLGQTQGNLQTLLANPYNPTFSSTPDAITQNMVSQGLQNINAQSSAANAAAARALSQGGGDNSALLGVLQRQSQIANAGAGNALIPMALQSQRENDLARIGAEQGARQLQLATFAQSSPLLQSLSDMAQAAGKRTARQSSWSKGSSNTRRSFF